MLSDSRFGTTDVAPDSDGKKKHGLNWETTGTTTKRGAINVTIHHLSEAGVLLATQTNLGLGEGLSVEILERGQTQATVVWQNSPLFACEFDDPISKASVSAALLRGQVRRIVSDPFAMRLGEADKRQSQLHSEEGQISVKSKLFVTTGLMLLSWALIGLVVVAIA